MTGFGKQVLGNCNLFSIYVAQGRHYGIVAVEEVLQVIGSLQAYADKPDAGFLGRLGRIAETGWGEYRIQDKSGPDSQVLFNEGASVQRCGRENKKSCSLKVAL